MVKQYKPITINFISDGCINNRPRPHFVSLNGGGHFFLFFNVSLPNINSDTIGCEVTKIVSSNVDELIL